MIKSIPKSEKSEKILQVLLTLPTDLSAIEDLLNSKEYTSDEISRAGYDYADECSRECLDYFDDHYDEKCYSDSVIIPDILSSNMYQIFELLLKYGLNPNAICDDGLLMSRIADVYNEYLATDTLALLLENGGDPDLIVDDENLFESIDFDVVFGAIEMDTRRIYDSLILCWLVLLGHGAGKEKMDSIDIFAKRHYECDLPDFKIEDLKNHRNYYYGISNVAGHGENWSLHIFDKRTTWEVLRL